MSIRWELRFGDCWTAYAGPNWRSKIGIVVPRDDGSIAWQIDGVSMSYIAKGYGETRSVRSAKIALERNWTKWLKAFNLESVK